MMLKRVEAMPAKCDAIISLADQEEEAAYCYVIKLDDEKKEACVIVGRNHQLHDTDSVVIEMYDEIKGVLCYQGTVKRITPDMTYLHQLSLVDERQRRSDVRVNVNIRLALKGVAEGSFLTKPDKKIILETLNVSANGMLLKSEHDIGNGNACLLFDFPLEKKYFSCKAQVIRKDAAGSHFIYGCRLLNKETELAELRRFVYKTQLELKKADYYKA